MCIVDDLSLVPSFPLMLFVPLVCYAVLPHIDELFDSTDVVEPDDL